MLPQFEFSLSPLLIRLFPVQREARGVARIAQTFILTAAAVGIHLLYRFALFLITLYST